MSSIAVIGCGAVGLTSALFLQQKLGSSAKITVFAEKFSPDTTSDVAAGLWEPLYLVGPDTSEEKAVKWAMDTYNYAVDLWKAGYAKDYGITLQPVLKLTEDHTFTPPDWLKYTLGYSLLSSDYLEKLSREHNRNWVSGISFVSFTWEASKFLPHMLEKFINNGGQTVNKTIKSLDDLSGFDAIINCTGLGARYLLTDLAVNPVRGQIARVSAPWQFNSLHVDGNYIIPNINCVILGGTKQNDFNTNLYELDTNYIFKGCTNVIPSLENARIIKQQVGLRPVRSEIRLEIEHKKLNGKIVKVLHNYGHGGSGISLCVGCANEVVDILEQSMRIQKCKL